MHFIWFLVGMPLICAIYGVYVARNNRIEEEREVRRRVESRHAITRSSSSKASQVAASVKAVRSTATGEAVGPSAQAHETSLRGGLV